MSFTATRHRLLVLDKNTLRAAAAADARTRADLSSLGVLVIDTTFKEIVRRGKWPNHYENDFRDWTDRPNRMSVSKGVGELLQEERRTARVAPIIDEAMTQRQRELLSALAAGDRTALVEAGPKVRAEAARMAGAGGELNPQERLALMRGLVDVWWAHGNNSVRQSVLAELNGSVDGSLVQLGSLVMTDGSVREALQNSLTGTGLAVDTAAALLGAPTFNNLLYSTFEAYSLILWAQGQRLDGVNAERSLNQMLDLDYVAYGLSCTGLLSNEIIIRRLEAGMRAACVSLWP